MNYYAHAMDIITDSETDFRVLVIEIAKKHPKIVFDASFRPPSLTGWQLAVLPCLRAKRKIEAIKICRANTGWLLKDAKDAVETLMETLEL